MTAEKAVVRSADDMDAEIFLKHINARHTPIGGMPVIGKSRVPHDEDEHLLRIYHDRLHATYDDYVPERGDHQNRTETLPNHVHGPSRKA